MHFIISILRRVRIEEYVALACLVIVTTLNIALFAEGPGFTEAWNLMKKYFTFGDPFFELFYLIAFWFVLVAVCYIAIETVRAKRRGLALEAQLELPMSMLARIRPFIIPAFTTVPFYELLGNMSYALRFSGEDELLLLLDERLFGVSPFVWLGNVVTSEFIAKTLSDFYLGLGICISLSVIAFFLIRSGKYLREYLLSFLLTLVFAFPVFALLPCQAPYPYIVQNIRGDEQLNRAREAREKYAPIPFILDVTKQISAQQEDAEHDRAVPISCIPSMHATWSLLIVMYLARFDRSTLVASVPWIILVLTGGLLLSQHYAVDYLASVPLTALVLYVTHLLMKFEAAYRSEARAGAQ